MFLVTEKQKMSPKKAKFTANTREDIQATMDFLLSRGMWSKYHHTHWSAFLSECGDPEMLHLWWDAITTGSMFEVESPLEESLEAPEVEIEMPLKDFKKIGGGGGIHKP